MTYGEKHKKMVTEQELKKIDEKRVKQRDKLYQIIFSAVLITGILPLMPYIFGQFYMSIWSILLVIYVLIITYYEHIYLNSQAKNNEQANHQSKVE